MARLSHFFKGTAWGKKAGGFVFLVGLVALATSFSTPRYSPAHAADWLEKVFSGFNSPSKPRYRKRRYRQQQRVYLPVERPRATKYKRSLSRSRRTRARGGKALGIGRIDGIRSKKSNKRRLKYVVTKSVGTTYRTMCVRTCDGYFFPVSFATKKGRLKKDARTCKSSCGAPARLYYYPNPGGETKDMVSYRGKRKYKKLKNAFLFKKKFVADCRCKPEPWTKAAKDKHVKYARTELKRKKRLASRKKRSRKKRVSKRRRKGRKYSRLSSKKRARIVRTVGSKMKRTRKKSSRKTRRVRKARKARKARKSRKSRTWTY